jgi:hypothetical protein
MAFPIHWFTQRKIAKINKQHFEENKMSFNLKNFGMNLAKGLTIGILGAEEMSKIVAGAGGSLSGQDKKNLALEAVGIGSAIASSVSPTNTDTINAVTSEASIIIDSLVKVFNITGILGKSSNSNPTQTQIPTTQMQSQPQAPLTK